MRYLYLSILVLFLAACSQAAPAPTQADPTASLPPPRLATGNPTAPLPASQTPQPSPTELPTPEPTQPPTPTSPVPPVPASVYPNPDDYFWQPVATGLSAPVGIEHNGDPNRVFIVEQGGQILILENRQVLQPAFLDIRDRVEAGGERGLLGLAFHPNFGQNGYLYVNYTDGDGDTHISRFTANPPDFRTADPASEKRLLFVDQPYPNHNGGELAFGPDGYLYIGLGDGGSAGDPLGNGQSANTFLGKILRLDVDQGEPYAIPPDNPFINGGGLPEIWAYGLRNPWRFSFDRETGDLYIGDVGQNAYEEIDFQPASSQGGENYGWSIQEGFACFRQQSCNTAGLVQPVHDFSHTDGECSVTGGVVVRSPDLPAWQGIYLFGDYCSGRIGGLLPVSTDSGDINWNHTWLFPYQGSISSFGEGAFGEVYVVDLGGNVFQLKKR